MAKMWMDVSPTSQGVPQGVPLYSLQALYSSAPLAQPRGWTAQTSEKRSRDIDVDDAGFTGKKMRAGNPGE